MKRIEVSLPFESALLKNQSHRTDRHTGRRGKTAACAKAMQDIVFTIRGECHKQGVYFVEGDIKLMIAVYRPKTNIDAQNVVDAVCDAVRDAINVDDRWDESVLTISKLDKADKRIVIIIEQEDSDG